MQGVTTTPLLCRPLPAAPRRLQVALVTETWLPEINGVAITLRHCVDGLLARGHGVEVIRPRQPGETATSGVPGLREVAVRGLTLPCYDTLKFGLTSVAALRRRWTAQRPDIVHIATEGPLGWAALRAARALALPVSTDFHTNFHAYSAHYGAAWLRQPILRYLRHFHNRATATFVPTTAMVEELQRLGFRNLVCVPRGVDTQRFSPAHRAPALRAAWGVGDDDPVVLCVGRLAPEKNLALALQSFGAIRRRCAPARLVMVGDGPLRADLAAANPDLVFAGQRTGADLAAHYASADLFLFPSLTETYGNVTLEALASGLPVVAYDYAATGEHVRHGRNGVAVPYGDATAFVDHAAALASDADRLRRLGAAARETAERLDWSVIAGEFARTLLHLTTQEWHEYPLGLSA